MLENVEFGYIAITFTWSILLILLKSILDAQDALNLSITTALISTAAATLLGVYQFYLGGQ